MSHHAVLIIELHVTLGAVETAECLLLLSGEIRQEPAVEIIEISWAIQDLEDFSAEHGWHHILN